MSEEQELNYWRMKYGFLEKEYEQLKERNQQLESRILEIVEKTEQDKLALSREIDILTQKLSSVAPSTSSQETTTIDEPEDPVMLDRSQPLELVTKPAIGKGNVIEYHHLPVLACDEGLIYGFRWEKGCIVKVV